MLALLALLSALPAALGQVRVQKLGVYDYFTEESSPVIFNGALLMVESIPTAYAGYDPASRAAPPTCGCATCARSLSWSI